MYIRTSLVCSTLRPALEYRNLSSFERRYEIRQVCVVFRSITKSIQYSTLGVRIEAVATSLQQGESTDRIQQFPAYFSKHPEPFYSRIYNSTIPRKGGRQQAVQSAIVSRVFRAVLPGRIFILSGSKALQAPPCFIPCSSRASSRASKHSTRQKLHSMRPKVTSSSLWCSRVAVEEEF